MPSPEVSIVLPTFNRLEYLRPAVDSVLAQTFSDWELIIADDGSDAETVDYLIALANPPRVELVRLAHSGNPGAVRNAAWRVARGRYIAFLDSDDVWLPEKLALQVSALRAHPQRGWSHTAFSVIDGAGQLRTGARARWWPATDGWILERLVRMETIIHMASVMVRRDLLERIGGFDPAQRMCEEYDLFLRLAACSEIQGVQETLLLARAHDKHWYPSSIGSIVLEDRDRALEKLRTASSDRALRSILRRERARVATSLARTQAAEGSRWAALRTLARSSRYSWVYPEWWSWGALAAARAGVPSGVVRVVRAVRGRGG